jgi:hypothetical protein
MVTDNEKAQTDHPGLEIIGSLQQQFIVEAAIISWYRFGSIPWNRIAILGRILNILDLIGRRASWAVLLVEISPSAVSSS